MATPCGKLFEEYDIQYVLSTYNTSIGAYVEIGCRRFAERIVGPSNVTCLPTGQWSSSVPKCAYTGELNSYEKIVIGVSAACLIFFVLCLLLICCLVYRWMNRREERRKYGYDDDSYPPSHVNLNAKGFYGSDVSDPRRKDYRERDFERRREDWDQDEAETRRKEYRKFDKTGKNGWDRELSETRRKENDSWGQERSLEPYEKNAPEPLDPRFSGEYNNRIAHESIYQTKITRDSPRDAPRDEGYVIYTGKGRSENFYENKAYGADDYRDLGQSRVPYRESNDVRRTQRDPYY